MMNNQTIFPTAKEMMGLTVSSGLERLMDDMKANAKRGLTSIKVYDKEEIKLIIRREGLFEALGYGVLSYRDWQKEKNVVEIIWGYDERQKK